MFKKSNAFFIGIIEGIGRLLAPHKMFWTYTFAVWLVAVFVLRLLGWAPGWLFSLWMWSIPFIGVFAFLTWLGNTDFFERPEYIERRERAEREKEDANGGRDREEEELRMQDKTRPGRR